MLVLRNQLNRPLTWDEMDHNLQVLEIDYWQPQDYEILQKVIVVDGAYTYIYNCVTSHVKEIYEPANTFITTKDSVTLWEVIATTYNGLPPNTDIYVTGMTYSDAYTGNTLTLKQTQGYPDVSVFIPSYALYDHYTSAITLTGTTFNLFRTGAQATLHLDLQPLIDIATGITHTDYYVTGATLTGAYHLELKRNDGVTVDVNLATLRDGNYFTTGATLSGTTAVFRKNFGSSYTLDLSAFAPTGGTGTSGYSGYSGVSVSGYSGYSGKSGYSGISGYSGLDGTATASGFSGYSGYSGLTGVSGTSGYSGSGISGHSGKSGYSGYSGKSGFSGYSGAQGLYGAASLILNGDGACTTDWAMYDETMVYDWEFISVSYQVITNTSGFTGNALHMKAISDYSIPCGAYAISYYLRQGVTYTLTFDYLSSSPLDISDGIYTYETCITASTITPVSLTMTAQNDGYLVLGAGTGRTLTPDVDWWIIDKVNLRCGSCGGGSGAGTSGYSGYSGLGSALTINHNADDRLLTANGGTTSIDAESGFTWTSSGVATIQHDLNPPVFVLSAFSTGNTSFGMGSETGQVNSAGPTHVTLRSRGTHNAMVPPRQNDVIYRQVAYATYGTGTTVTGTTDILDIRLTCESDYTDPNSPFLTKYVIKTRNIIPATDSLMERFIIQTDGSIWMPFGMATRDVKFNGIGFYTGNTTMGDSFTYLANVGNSTVTFSLPLASDCAGRVYYVALNTRGSGTLRLDVNGHSSDKIAWAYTRGTFNAVGDFLMVQSDGVNNWLILSQNSVTFS